ncbi:aryl-alcohol dehydrogenase [Sparassis latifolia]
MTTLETKKMPYVRLGNSGLKVSKIILGCMTYGSSGWQEWVLDEEEAIRHIKFAYEHGIQTFDTADMYSNGLSEVILGKAIKQLNLPREEIVVMTKLFMPFTPGKWGTNIFSSGQSADEIGLVNQHGLSRKHIFDAVKASLERLQLDYVPVTMNLVDFSSHPPSPVHAMQNYAIRNKLTPFVAMQNHYSLMYREEEREMFPTLKMFGVGSIPFSPLGRGVLARPLTENSKRGETDPFQKIYKGVGTPEIVKRVEEVAKKKGISMAQVAIAWCLAKDGVSAPIVGTTSLDNLKDIIGGVHVTLGEDEIKYLEEPYIPQNIVGHA